MPEENIEDMAQARAKKYARSKYALAIANTVYLLLLIFLSESLGIAKSFAQSLCAPIKFGCLVFPVYLAGLFIAYSILQFPLNWYGSFILEHKFSLTTQKFGAWLGDQLKAGLVGYIISLIGFGAFYLILKNNPASWWLIVSLFWIFFSIILAKVMPVVIIPLFFKYKPLSDENLKQRIINLAETMRIKVLDVFEIDFSKKTLKGNAAFLGIGKTKRVILADTLKDKYSYDEIEVILAHEFSHYRLKHLWKLVLINSLSTLLFFYIIFRSYSYGLNFFGLADLNDLAAFPVIIMYLVLLGIITQPLENYLSRRFEKNADSLALKTTGLKEAFISMMNKLSSQNLSERNPHPIIKFFFFDHPPAGERIASAESFKK